MVIRKSDRVSTVLRADESLIEVFVALSPAFERLRNPAMRKVMSRLVTVEQAARMAGIDGDELVSRLNEGGSGADPVHRRDDVAESAGGTVPETSGVPPGLRAIRAEAIVEVDVREDLRNGKEPFSRIMSARRDVPSGGALRVRAIFEPVPLYAVMEKQGLAHHTEQLGPEDWSVWFYPAGEEESAVPGSEPGAPAASEASPANRTPAAAGNAADADGGDGVVVLDVRGLEPPEPMVRTLAALEELPPGGTLVQLNVRIPQFLLPQLEERGFAFEIREQSPELVRVFITKNRTGE